MSRTSTQNGSLIWTTRLCKMSLRLLFLGLLLLSVLLIHCQKKEPEDLSPKEEDLLVETTALLSLAAQELAGDSEHLTARQDSIFSSLGTTREEYHRLVEKMGQNPEGWLEVWERIAKRIEEVTGRKAQE
jgi:hypothetical protein